MNGLNDTLRPQAFGRRNGRTIDDPIIEPLWIGDRVLVRFSAGDVRLLDTKGEPFGTTDGVDEILPQLERAILAQSAVLDGYLTRQATPPVGTVALLGPEVPTAGQMTSQFFVGGLRTKKLGAVEAEKVDTTNPLAFVAIDLLALDDESLLDIPLLERKRLLESVLAEDRLIRRSAYVRPPVDAWLASWRALGFRELAYKSANSRYTPGSSNEGWAIVRIPTN
jgi:ATP dependent DNA ligase-like protein